MKPIKNRFKHIITTIIGTMFLFMSFGVALISYFDSIELGVAKLDYTNSVILMVIGLFLIFAEDELINQLLLGIPQIIKSKLGIKDEPKQQDAKK